MNKVAQALACAAALLLPALLQAQQTIPYNPSAQAPRAGGRGRGRGPAQPARVAAPIDMTGYWVSVVTEDWKFRMVTPKKGNYSGVPLNAEGRKVADTWDPAIEASSGDQCKPYGAAGLMRVPGRLHITWDNDTTMKIETDAGMQTRVLHFGLKDAPANAEPSLQGYSVAEWEAATTGRGQPRTGDLKVVTSHLAPGYLRTNGVPYSASTILTEWYDRISDPSGEWLVVSTEVRDPQYLSQPFITSTHFRKQADAKGWMPAPCSSR